MSHDRQYTPRHAASSTRDRAMKMRLIAQSTWISACLVFGSVAQVAVNLYR